MGVMMNFLKIIALSIVLFLTACPIEGDSGPVETCTEVAQQCRMAQGQLGVCTSTMDGALLCMPQH